MIRMATICIAIFLASSGTSAGDLYKCTVDGKVRYTDTPCSKREINLDVQRIGGPVRNAAAKKKEPRDAVLEIRGDKDDPNQVTGSLTLVGAGNNFECDDPAYAGVDKEITFRMSFADGTSKNLCRRRGDRSGGNSMPRAPSGGPAQQ